MRVQGGPVGAGLCHPAEEAVMAAGPRRREAGPSDLTQTLPTAAMQPGQAPSSPGSPRRSAFYSSLPNLGLNN